MLRRFLRIALVLAILLLLACPAYASPTWNQIFQANSKLPLDEQVPPAGFGYFGVSQSFPNDQSMIALSDGNIYFSSNAGVSWIGTTFNPPTGSGTHNDLTIPPSSEVYLAPDFANSHLAVFSGLQGLYSATVSFYQLKTLIPENQLSFGDGDIAVLTATDITPPNPGGMAGGAGETPYYAFTFGPNDTMYASNGPGLYQSTDQGKDWSQIYYAGAIINGVTLSPDFASDHTMICATDSGVFISTDGGTHFKQVDLPLASGRYDVSFSPDYSQDGTVGAIVPGVGVYLSTDGGGNWTEVFNHRGSVSLALTGHAVYVGTNATKGQMQGVYASFDQGTTWSSEGLTDQTTITRLLALQGSGTDTLYALPGNGLPQSTTISIPTNAHKPGRQASPSVPQNGVVFTIESDQYTVDGQSYSMDAVPFISGQGRTFVPVRYLAQALGASIVWYRDTQTVILSNANTSVRMVIDSYTLVVNGQAQTMDAVPEIVNGRTMLPARWVAQAFGCSVHWDGANQRVIVTQ